jgi:hypothetical protein
VSRGLTLRLLLVLWLALGAAGCAIVFVQTAVGKYGSDVMTVWSWFAACIIPCFTLLMTAALTDSPLRWHEQSGDNFRFWLAAAVSFLYLAAVLFVLLIEPLISSGIFALLDNSTLFLAIAQGVVVMAISAVIFQGR